MRRALTTAAVALAGILAGPASADAYVVGGYPWPYDVVTYSSDAPAYTASVDRAARILKANPGVRIRIEGYTDNVGSVRVNRELSAARAEVVRLQNGIGRKSRAQRGSGKEDGNREAHENLARP